METKRPALPSKLTDHYSNILLLAPDGAALATIPAKRARWYKKRNLVEVIENRDGYTEVLRMTVEPAGRPTKEIRPLPNQCVVCGSSEILSLHHVVPRAVRIFFAPSEKQHASNWCVLVCETHHLAAEKLARELYEKKLQTAVGAAHLVHTKICYDLIKSAIQDGKTHADVDLKSRKDERKNAVKEAHKICALELIAELGGCQKTKELFKEKFMELQPKYLPQGFLTDDWQK